MSLDAYNAYRWGKRSAEKLVQALRDVLCCHEPGRERECKDTLARLAPFISGSRDCGELEWDLEPYFAWLSLRWAYSPCGEPPSAKKRLVVRALCSARLPLDEEVFKNILGERESEDYGGEET